MATYVIGDVQGCFTELKALLTKINFSEDRDQLWFTGDLVNRGPNSLEVVRHVRNLCMQGNALVVLGNHDLHLLACGYQVRPPHPKDTLHSILTAADRYELLDWLRVQPLLHHDSALNALLVHAGICPTWNLEDAHYYANKLSNHLQSDHAIQFFSVMYGNEPTILTSTQTELEQLRVISNYFTRMRFCTQCGHLDLTFKGTIDDAPPGLIPWFKVPRTISSSLKLVFGHWAALQGHTGVENIYCVDTGCVWGNRLSALCLETLEWFSVPSIKTPSEKF